MKVCTKGSILIAAPHLVDPNFTRTVVLMVEHSDEGGFGLVLNRPGSTTVSELWSMLSTDPCPGDAGIYVGGPVQTSSIFLLHTCSDLADGAEPVVAGIFLGNDLALLATLLERQRALRDAGSEEEIVRVYCGYSGWGEGQLDRELETGSWVVQPATTEFLLETQVADLWSRSLERAGGIYRLFSLMPHHPERN